MDINSVSLDLVDGVLNAIDTPCDRVLSNAYTVSEAPAYSKSFCIIVVSVICHIVYIECSDLAVAR
jgi:hypothetical protein